MPRGGSDVLQIGNRGLLPRVFRFLDQAFGEPEDRVQWRAQLGAHVGEEGCLDAIGFQRLVARHRQLGFGAAALGELQTKLLVLLLQALVQAALLRVEPL